MSHQARRIAVTGMGAKTPAGTTIDEMWQTLVAARPTAARITTLGDYDVDALSVRIACEVPEFDPVPYLGPKESRRQDRAAQLGFAAAADAIAAAGELSVDPARVGVVVGTGIGGLRSLEAQVETRVQSGPARVSPFLVPMMMANATSALVALQYGYTGPNLTVATACAASANAIGEAYRLVRDGSCDVVIAGGTESCITPTAIAAFARMTALSGRNDDPAAASRPFDADRDGFVMGEGAAFLVLEDWDRAVARGAVIVGEIAGYGRNCDAFHVTAPSPGGAGAAACMAAAIADAGIETDEIGHINAHGTSTPLNDAAEAEAIAKVFGREIPVTSTKGVIGHLVGAAGATEAIATFMALRDQTVPPTANFERTDIDVALDIVAGEARSVPSRYALSNSFGFGGHNASLVLGAA